MNYITIFDGPHAAHIEPTDRTEPADIFIIGGLTHRYLNTMKNGNATNAFWFYAVSTDEDLSTGDE